MSFLADFIQMNLNPDALAAAQLAQQRPIDASGALQPQSVAAASQPAPLSPNRPWASLTEPGVLGNPGMSEEEAKAFLKKRYADEGYQWHDDVLPPDVVEYFGRGMQYGAAPKAIRGSDGQWYEASVATTQGDEAGWPGASSIEAIRRIPGENPDRKSGADAPFYNLDGTFRSAGKMAKAGFFDDPYAMGALMMLTGGMGATMMGAGAAAGAAASGASAGGGSAAVGAGAGATGMGGAGGLSLGSSGLGLTASTGTGLSLAAPAAGSLGGGLGLVAPAGYLGGIGGAMAGAGAGAIGGAAMDGSGGWLSSVSDWLNGGGVGGVVKDVGMSALKSVGTSALQGALGGGSGGGGGGYGGGSTNPLAGFSPTKLAMLLKSYQDASGELADAKNAAGDASQFLTDRTNITAGYGDKISGQMDDLYARIAANQALPERTPTAMRTSADRAATAQQLTPERLAQALRASVMPSLRGLPSDAGLRGAYVDAAKEGPDVGVLRQWAGRDQENMQAQLARAIDAASRRVDLREYDTRGVKDRADQKFSAMSSGVDRANAIAASQGFAQALRGGVADSTAAATTANNITREFADVYSKLREQSDQSALAENEAIYKAYIGGKSAEIDQNSRIASANNQAYSTAASTASNSAANYERGAGSLADRLMKALGAQDQNAIKLGEMDLQTRQLDDNWNVNQRKATDDWNLSNRRMDNDWNLSALKADDDYRLNTRKLDDAWNIGSRTADQKDRALDLDGRKADDDLYGKLLAALGGFNKQTMDSAGTRFDTSAKSVAAAAKNRGDVFAKMADSNWGGVGTAVDGAIGGAVQGGWDWLTNAVKQYGSTGFGTAPVADQSQDEGAGGGWWAGDGDGLRGTYGDQEGDFDLSGYDWGSYGTGNSGGWLDW